MLHSPRLRFVVGVFELLSRRFHKVLLSAFILMSFWLCLTLLCQAVQAVAPPPRPRKAARAWAHPGTEIGGVICTTAAAAMQDDADQSPKVCCAMQLVRGC